MRFWLIGKMGGRKKSLFIQAVVWSCIGLAVLGMVLSNSRNVWLMGSLFFLILGWKRLRWIGLSVAVLGISSLVYFTPLGRHVFERFQTALQSPSRIAIWRVGILNWQQHPILGIGPKMFPQEWPKYHKLATEYGFSPYKSYPHHTHSIFLEALTERGLLGLFSFVVLSGYCLWRIWRARKEENLHQEVLFVGFALTLLLICGLFDFSFRYRWYPYSFFFLCGLAISFGTKRFEGDGERAKN